MKLISKCLWLLAALCLLAVSCAKDQSETPAARMTDMPSITATTTAEVSTKVTVGACEGQKKLVNWDKGDAISVFYHNVANLKFDLEGEGGSPTGVFNYASGNGLGLEFPEIYGVYPYNAATAMQGDVILTDFPAEQAFSEKTFDPKSNLMVAVSKTTDLFFQHVGGFLLLQLYGEDVQVVKAEFTGNGGEILAGPAEIYAAEGGTPDIWLNPETGVRTLTLTSDEPVAVHEGRDEPTEFWLVVPPTVFEEGFTVTVTDVNGEVFVAELTSAAEIERNTILRMNPLCLKKVASPFETEVAWTYAEDAEVDRNLFYEFDGTTDYSRTALPLGIDAAITEKYGEEIAGTAPESIKVRVADVPAAGAEPEFEDLADDASFSVGDLTLKEGVLVADVESFEWDKVYEITYQYALNTCDLTLTGTITTVDRNREAVTLPVFEYTFDINKLDEETGFGYVEKEPVENSYYYWKSEDISADVFSAFLSAGVIKADDFADVVSFRAAELSDRITYAGGSAWDWVKVSTEDLFLYTLPHFTAKMLKSSLFNSGEQDPNDPYLFVGNDLDRKITSYIGQEIIIPLRFNYRVPAYDFKHQANYTFNDGVWYAMANPKYDLNKACLEVYDVNPMSLPQLAFNIIDEDGRFYDWKNGSDGDNYFYDPNLRASFFFTDPDLGEKKLEPQCQTDDIISYKDLWLPADPEAEDYCANFEHALFYYRTIDDAIPMYGTLQVLSGDTYFDIPTSFNAGCEEKYLAGEDYSDFELRSWKPFYVLDYDRTVTVTLDENMIYAIDLFEGIQIYDGRQVAASTPVAGEVFEGDEGVYKLADFNQGTASYMRPMLGYNGAREPVWDWIYGNVTESGTSAIEGEEPNGYADGYTSGQAYGMKTPVFAADIPSEYSKLISLNGRFLEYNYSSEVQFTGRLTIKATIDIPSPWYKFEPFTVNVVFQGYGYEEP